MKKMITRKRNAKKPSTEKTDPKKRNAEKTNTKKANANSRNLQRALCQALVLTLVLTLALLCLGGCSAGKPAASGEGRIVVTMLYTGDLPSLEELVETTYPDIDLQIERNAQSTIDGETERRLRNGHGSDIVVSTLATGDVLNYLADLSADEYISAYQSGIMHKMSRDGKNLFIPLPAQYYGYIYNVTLARENGLTAPTTQEEMFAMLQKAKENHIGADENGSVFAVNGTPATTAAFAVATKIPDFFGLSEGVRWMEDMKNGKASFQGTLEPCLDLPLEMIEKEYMDPLPFAAVSNCAPILEKMSSGETLMAFDTVAMLDNIRKNSSDEFDMLPMLSSEGNPSWTVSAPTAFLGINKVLTEDGNEAGLDACRRILGLLSTPEGQDAFMKDNGASYSYLVDYTPVSDTVPEGIKDCIEDGYNYNISIPSDFMRYFGNRCNAVLCGQKDIADAIAEVDEYMQGGGVQNAALIGTIDHDMIVENYNVRLEETEIGNLISDAVREITGADIAVVNGGSIRGSLYEGDIYSYDLDYVCPYQDNIIVLEVNADVIRSMLSNGLSAMVRDVEIPGGRFLNVSGLKYSFTPPTDVSPAQLADVTLADGTPLDENAVYTLAVTNYMAGGGGYFDNNGDGFTMLNVYSDDTPKGENVKLVRETEYTFRSILEEYIISHNDEEIASQIEGRITAVNENE